MVKEKLNENNFKVNKYEIEGDCINHIKRVRKHTWVVLTPNMEIKT